MPRTREAVIPVLPSRDLVAAEAFYGRLGFNVRGRFENYLILTRDWIELHFFRHPDLNPATNETSCYIRNSKAEAMHAAFAHIGLPRTGIPRLRPVAETQYRMIEFALIDPDGNLIRIGRPRD